MKCADADLLAALMSLIDASPSPAHLVRNVVKRLEASGFQPLTEELPFELEPGQRRYVVRDGSALCAFRIGNAPLEEAGLRIAGAHTDSPALKLKPRPELETREVRSLGVEVYGGPILATWLDRPLRLAGQVAVLEGEMVRRRLVELPFHMTVPSLALHLNREVNEKGLILNPQTMLPVLLADGREKIPSLEALLGDLLSCAPECIVGHDLIFGDATPASLCGLGGEFLSAPRLDDQAMCCAAIEALCGLEESLDTTAVTILFDHEEIGSRSNRGAAGAFLGTMLRRMTASLGKDEEAHLRTLAGSTLLSLDAAHALHPNHASLHDPTTPPLLNRGAVLKVNADLHYGTEALTGGQVRACCRRLGLPLQTYVHRADLRCGSTIGPIVASELGIHCADVGPAILAMHAVRELMGVADLCNLTTLTSAFFTAAEFAPDRASARQG